jgi:hypothetical protein
MIYIYQVEIRLKIWVGINDLFFSSKKAIKPYSFILNEFKVMHSTFFLRQLTLKASFKKTGLFMIV